MKLVSITQKRLKCSEMRLLAQQCNTSYKQITGRPKMNVSYKGRELEILDIWGSLDDIQFQLCWADEPNVDLALDVPEDVYDFVAHEYSSELYERMMDKNIMDAEYAFEGDR